MHRIPPRKERRGLCTPTILYDGMPTGGDGRRPSPRHFFETKAKALPVSIN
jgi:hypothetical protein